MRTTIKTLVLAGAISLALPSLANARKFENTIASPLTTSVKIEIVMSEEMQHRANNLPTKLRDRDVSSSRGLNRSFSSNGFLGERDLDILARDLEKKMTRKFTKKGIMVSEDAPVTLLVTLENAKNNRPTPAQLRKDINLSFQSFAVGGAEMSADLIDADGQSLGTMSYKFYENDIFQNQQFGGIWQDANRSFSRFAKNAAKTLAN